MSVQFSSITSLSLRTRLHCQQALQASTVTAGLLVVIADGGNKELKLDTAGSDSPSLGNSDHVTQKLDVIIQLLRRHTGALFCRRNVSYLSKYSNILLVRRKWRTGNWRTGKPTICCVTFFLSQINLTVKIMKNQTVCLHPVGLTK